MMPSMKRSALLVAALALAGCPPSTSPLTPMANRPGHAPALAAQPAPDPKPGPKPDGPGPKPGPDPGLPTPTPAPTPPGDTPPKDPRTEAPPAQTDGEVLKKGARRRIRADRHVGLVDIEAGTADVPPRARLDVAAGACFLQAMLPAGSAVDVGGVSLELLAIDPDGELVRVRERPGASPDAPVKVVAAPAGGPNTLDGLSLHAFSDGVWLGVGNVRSEKGRSIVTLHLFPPGYAEKPTMGYDLHLDVTLGAELVGKVRKVKVTGLEHGSLAGKVTLELAPP